MRQPEELSRGVGGGLTSNRATGTFHMLNPPLSICSMCVDSIVNFAHTHT